MNATGTFFSVLLAHFIYQNDKLSYNKVLGCILGFTGVMVVNFSSGLDFSFSLLGDGSVVMAAFILSAATLYGKRISQDGRPDGNDRISVGRWRSGAGYRRLRFWWHADRTRCVVGGDSGLPDVTLFGRFCVVEYSAQA
ncbi:Uncharacterised protein [Citrobacter freundii]|nr:Uncharacterised protein [Citrobacter freundii]